MQQGVITWEQLRTTPGPCLQRARVPGGWLVVFYEMETMTLSSDSGGPNYSGDVPYGGMTFVPDAAHAWAPESSVPQDAH